MIWAVALLLLTPVEDPRISLVELQSERLWQQALALADQQLGQDPEAARALGLDYLRGHLWERLERPERAGSAYAQALTGTPTLAVYARLRMAELQERLGHPEVAAGLVATVLGQTPPASLVADAMDLLGRSLEAGGDCRLLQKSSSWRLQDPQRRQLSLLRAECARRSGDFDGARDALLAILRDATEDDVARTTALRTLALPGTPPESAETLLLLGRSFHAQREFDRAIPYLEKGLAAVDAGPGPRSRDADYEDRYALARSHFWQARYPQAAAAFAHLAERSAQPEHVARARYQQARSEELAGEWLTAGQTFLRCLGADPTGPWADAALLSALRIEWRLGREGEALQHFAHLGSRAAWRELSRRAALFLASSDLVRRRTDRAESWLARASSEETRVEVAYWRGRLAELLGDFDGAVGQYLGALQADRYHPLSLAALERLQTPDLTAPARREAGRLAAGGQAQGLYSAWLLLGDGDVQGRAARLQLEQLLRRQPRSRAFLEVRSLPIAEWPLWQAPPTRAGDLLLGLGIWEQGEPFVLEHFPVSEPNLAFTGSERLASAGLARPSLRVAEVLVKRAPSSLPPPLLPSPLRRLLFPLPYADLIARETGARGVDPYLLAAILREESRFDPRAVSPAAARGLAQFVLPTARRLAPELGLQQLEPEDLEAPANSIALGALYLSHLAADFAGRVPAMVAAYNAGEDQTRLWESYCYSRDPAELYTKVGFKQTRDYLRKVLSSRAQYLEVWAAAR